MCVIVYAEIEKKKIQTAVKTVYVFIQRHILKGDKIGREKTNKQTKEQKLNI